MSQDQWTRRRAPAAVALAVASFLMITGETGARASKPAPPPPTPTATKMTAWFYRQAGQQTVHIYAILMTADGQATTGYVNGEPIVFSYQATPATGESTICTDTTKDVTIMVFGPSDYSGFAQCEMSAADFAKVAAVGFVARFSGDATYTASQATFSAEQTALTDVSSHVPA